MIHVRRFILYSTVAGLFTTAIYFTVGTIAIQIFYLLMILNLVLMLLIKRLWAPVGLLFLSAFIAVTGILGIINGVDTVTRFAKEFVGISITTFYFCSFFRTIEFNLEEAIGAYVRVAYWIAIIGIILWPIRLLLGGDYRLRSILTEPSMFVLTCIPALYYFADSWQRHRTYGREAIVMSVAFILTGSSNGFLAILFGLAIFLMRYRRARLLLPAIVGIIGLGFYTGFADVQLRINDSLHVFQDADLTGTNLSTWALFSNAFVTSQVLQVHPLLGNGLGSHGLSYERYIGSVKGVEDFAGTTGESLNAEDANSLALRVLSDMGYLGAILVVWFIWKYRPKGESETDVMSKAIWLYFFVKLLRGGHYFSNEQYFFVAFYALNRGSMRLEMTAAATGTVRKFRTLALPPPHAEPEGRPA